MYCSSCGQETQGAPRFCSRCGRAMQSPPASQWDGLVRLRAGRKVAGVCAGMAARFGWDLALLRVITLLIAVFTFPLGVIAYGILWVALPEEPLYLPASAPPVSVEPQV